MSVYLIHIFFLVSPGKYNYGNDSDANDPNGRKLPMGEGVLPDDEQETNRKGLRHVDPYGKELPESQGIFLAVATDHFISMRQIGEKNSRFFFKNKD